MHENSILVGGHSQRSTSELAMALKSECRRHVVRRLGQLGNDFSLNYQALCQAHYHEHKTEQINLPHNFCPAPDKVAEVQQLR
ncbi:hypothetical protein [Arsukibacterium sp.]|uniref:hypothetical protein n=1 Tax=Arsukibacterium sp. TaxID=1977258 RepID=UPI003568D12A